MSRRDYVGCPARLGVNTIGTLSGERFSAEWKGSGSAPGCKRRSPSR